jgi:hypothetical protein
MYNNNLEDTKLELEALLDSYGIKYKIEEDINLEGSKVYFHGFNQGREKMMVIMTTVNDVFSGCTTIPNKIAYFKKEGLTEEQILDDQPVFSGVTESPEILLGLVSMLLQEA